jgi:hypothetical protein
MPEPIYTVIYRGSQANSELLTWARANGADAKHIEGNRLHIYNHNMFERFRLTWTRDWRQVTVWDCWNRRHIETN